MALPKLVSCPKCKGQLLLETDNYGLYQQCLQCGYIYDLQDFPIVEKQQLEQDEEVAASQCSIEDGSNNKPHKTPSLPQYSPDKAFTVPRDLELILSSLHKGSWDNRL